MALKKKVAGIKKPLKHEHVTAPDTDSDNESDGNSADNAPEGNAGWADSIAKVLNTTKPKTKKTLVLSRAKKTKVGKNAKTDEDFGFEIEGEIKKEDIKLESDEDDVKPRKNVPLQLRVKPTWKDMERERTLRKVATRGVVQLFNAVRMQQKDLQHKLEEAGPLDSRKDAVLNNINKRKFLDVLMSGSRAQSQAIDNSVKSEIKKQEDSSDAPSDDDDEDKNSAPSSKKKSEWNVLREDFMTNKKIKHWDEQQDGDNSDQQEGTGDEADDNDDDD